MFEIYEIQLGASAASAGTGEGGMMMGVFGDDDVQKLKLNRPQNKNVVKLS